MQDNKLEKLFSGNNNLRMFTPTSTVEQSYEIANKTDFVDVGYDLIDWSTDAAHDFYRSVQKGEMDENLDMMLVAKQNRDDAQAIINFLNGDKSEESTKKASNALNNLRTNGVWDRDLISSMDGLKNLMDRSQEEYQTAYDNYQHNLEQYNDDVKNYDISQYYSKKSNEAVMNMGNFFYKLPATMGTSNTSPALQTTSMVGGWAGAKVGAAAGAQVGAPAGPLGAAIGSAVGSLVGAVGGAQAAGGMQSRELESHMEAFSAYRERTLNELQKRNIDLTKVIDNVRQQLIQNGEDVSRYTDDMLLDQALINPNIKSGDTLFNDIAKETYKGSRVLYEKNNALGFGEVLSDLTYFVPVGKWVTKGLGTVGGKIAKATKIDKMLSKRLSAGTEVAKASLSQLTDDAVKLTRKQKAWDMAKRLGFNALIEGSEEGAQSILSNEYITGKFDEEVANESFLDALTSGDAFVDVAENIYRRGRATAAAFTPFDPEYSDDAQLREEFFVGMLLPFTSPQGVLGNVASIRDAHKVISNTKKFADYYSDALAQQDAIDRKVDFVKNIRENKVSLRGYDEVLDNISNLLKSGKYDTSVLSDDGKQLSEQDIDNFFNGQKSQYTRINKLVNKYDKQVSDWGFDEDQKNVYFALLDEAKQTYAVSDNTSKMANMQQIGIFSQNATKEDFKGGVLDLNGIDKETIGDDTFRKMSIISAINHRIVELNKLIAGYQLQSTIQSQMKKNGVVDNTNVLQMSKLQDSALRMLEQLEKQRDSIAEQILQTNPQADIEQIKSFDDVSEELSDKANQSVQLGILSSLQAEYDRNKVNDFQNKDIAIQNINRYNSRIKRQHKLADQANEIARTGKSSEQTKKQADNNIQNLTEQQLIQQREEMKQNLSNELASLEETLAQIPQGSILRNYADTIVNGRNLYKTDEDYVQYIENVSKQLAKKYGNKAMSDELSEKDKKQLKELGETADSLGNYAKAIRDSISEEQARASRRNTGFGANNKVYTDNNGNRYQFKMQESEYSEKEGLVLKMIKLDDNKNTEYDKTIKDLENLREGIEKRKWREGKNQDKYDKLIDRINKQIEATKIDRDGFIETTEVVVNDNLDFLNQLTYTNNKGEVKSFSDELNKKINQVDKKIEKDIEQRRKLKEQASIVGDVVEDNKSEASTPKWTIIEQEESEDRELKTLSYPIGNDSRTKSIFTNPYHQASYWYGEITMPYSNEQELKDRLVYKNQDGETVDNTEGVTGGVKWSRIKAMHTFHAIGKAIQGLKRSEVIDALQQLMDGKNVKIGNKTFKASDYENMINVLPLITRLRQSRLNHRPFILVHPDLGSVGKLEKFSKNEKQERTKLINELLYSYKTVEEAMSLDDVLYADETVEARTSNRVYVKTGNVTVAFAKFAQSLEIVRDQDDIVYRKDDGTPMSDQEISDWYNSQLERLESEVRKNVSELVKLLEKSFNIDEKKLNETITDKNGNTYTPLQKLMQGAVKYGDGIISLSTFQQSYILPALGHAKKTQNVKVANQKRAFDILDFFQNTIPSAFLSYRDFQKEFGNTPDVRVTVDEAISKRWSPKIKVSQNGVELNFKDRSDENKAAISVIMQQMENLLTESKTADEFIQNLEQRGFTFEGTITNIDPERVLREYFNNRRFSRLEVPSNIVNALTLASPTPLNSAVDYSHFRKTTRVKQHKINEVKSLGLVKDKYGNYLFSKLKYAKRFVEQEVDGEVTSIFDTRIEEVEASAKEAEKILKKIKKIKKAFNKLRDMYKMDEETFENTYLRDQDGRKLRLSRMLLYKTLDDLKQKQIDAIEVEREAAIAEQADAEEFQDRDTLPLTIAYAAASVQGSNRGPIVYIDPKTGEKHTMQGVTGTPGSVYLRLPSFFNPSRKATIVKLNPSKLDRTMADVISNLLVGINNGLFTKDSKLTEALEKVNLSGKSDMTVEQFLDQFVYMGTEAVKRNPSSNNMDRLLYIDGDGKVMYGNTIDGQGNVASDAGALTDWLIDNKPVRVDRNKLMKLGSKLDFDLEIYDASGNKIYEQSKDTPYITYLIDNGVVTTDMDVSENSHIFEEPRVYTKYESKLNLTSSSNDETTKGTAANAKAELKKEVSKKSKISKDVSSDDNIEAFKSKNKSGMPSGVSKTEEQINQEAKQFGSELKKVFDEAIATLSEEETDVLYINVKLRDINGKATKNYVEPSLGKVSGEVYQMTEVPVRIEQKIKEILAQGKSFTFKLLDKDHNVIKVNGKEVSYTVKGSGVKSTKESVVETAGSSNKMVKQQLDLASLIETAAKNNMRVVQNADGSIEVLPISADSAKAVAEKPASTETVEEETKLAKKGIVVPTFTSTENKTQQFEAMSWGEMDKNAANSVDKKPSFAEYMAKSKAPKVQKTEPKTVVDFNNFDSAQLDTILDELRDSRKEKLPNDLTEVLSNSQNLSDSERLEQARTIVKKIILTYLTEINKVNLADALKTLNSISDVKLNIAITGIRNVPFKGVAEKFAKDYIETEDYDKAVSRAEKILGKNFPLQIDTTIKKVWDNVRQAQIYVFGQCTSAGIRLVKMANGKILKGSLYHESFHNISLFVLSSSERKAMYKHAMDLYPELDGMNFKQVEEFLADKFSEFVLDNDLKKTGKFYNSNPINKFFQKIFDTIRTLLNRLFNANITPKYKNLNKLFRDMYSGRYAYAKATKDNIEEFNKVYSNYIAYKGIKIYGAEVADNAKQAYEIYRELLSRLLMNSNALTQYEGELLLDYDAVKTSIQSDLETYTNTLNSLIEEGSSDIDALLKYNNLIRINQRILENWDVWRKYVKQQVSSKFKLDDSHTNDPDAALEGMTNTIQGSDVIYASYSRDQYNSMDMNVKMLLFSVTETDQLTADGLSKYANPYQLFQELGILCERCTTVQQMMNKIMNEAKRQNKNGSDVYSQIYSLLEKAEPHVKNSFFTNLVKFRNNFVNTVYETIDNREDGSPIYSASVRSSNQEAINSRTTKQWKDAITQSLTTLASTEGLNTEAKRSEKIKDFKKALREAINNPKLFTKEGAEQLSSALLDTYGVVADSDILFKWLSQFKESSDKKALRDAMIKEILGAYKSEDVFKKELNMNKILKVMFGEKSVLRSFGEFMSEKSAPSIKTDSVRGASGSKIHVISQYNFINRLFNVVAKTEEWVNKMSVNPYCFNSTWLNAFKPFADKNAVHPTIGIETYIATVADGDYMNSRDYMGISGIEDLMNKFVAVLSGRHIIPSLANKKTYYYLKGFADVDKVVNIAGVDRLYITDTIKQQFVGYLADEFLAIANAYKTREMFLKELNSRLKTKYTAETFSKLSATEQEEIFRKPEMKGLLNMLVNTYHYGNGASEFIKREDGSYIRRAFRINLTKGNGYTFRHFKKMMDGVTLTKEQIDKLTVASTVDVNDENARNAANEYAMQLAQKYQDRIEESILNNIALAVNRFIHDGIINGDMVKLTGKPAMFTNTTLSNVSIPVDVVLNSKVLNLAERKENELSSNEILRAIAQYAVSGMIDTIEFEKLCSGDIAFFKDITAVNKRYSALTSTRSATADKGTIVNAYTEDRLHDSPTYRTMTFNTTLVVNKNLYEQYVKQALGVNAVSSLSIDDGSVVGDVDYKALLDKDGNFKREAKKGVLVQVYLQHRKDKLSYGVDDKGEPLSDVELAKRIVENVKERYEGYLNTDPTDAQVWISAEMARQLKQREGKWNEASEACYDLLENYDRIDKLIANHPAEFANTCSILGITPAEVLDKFQKLYKSGDAEKVAQYKGWIISKANNMDMTSYKYVHYGYSADRTDGLYAPIYDKMSLSPIFKIWSEDHAMKDMYDFMVENGVEMAKMETSVKSGGVPSFEMVDENSNFNKQSLLNSAFQDQYFSQLGKQLNTDPHHTTTSTLLTQFMKVAVMNIVPTNKYVINGQTLTGAELLSTYQSILDELTLRGYEKFRSKYGIKNGKVDKAKFMRELQRMSETQDMPMETLEALTVDENGEYVVHPAALPNINWIQSRLIADMDRTIIKTVTPGQPLYQVSSMGYSNVQNIKKHKDVHLSMRNERGRMEVKLSINFFADVLEQAGLTNASFEEQRAFILENQELFALSYRVPTQGQNSTLAIEIVDVLEPQRGAIIMFPAEITALTGSDFDIDKMFLARPNFYVDENGKMRKLDYDVKEIMSNISGVEDKRLQNMLLDIFQTVLTSPQHMLDATTPLDVTIGPLKAIKKKIEGIVGKGSDDVKEDLWYLNPIFQTDQKIKNSGSDNGIGPMALNNVFRFFIQMSNLKLKPNKYLTDLGLTTMNRIYDRNGENILDSTSALINAHVDAVKDNYIGRMNVNGFTFDVTSFLITTGMGNDTYWFLGQPILKEVASNWMNYKNGVLGVPEDLRQGDAFMDMVITEYTKLSGDIPITSLASKEEMTQEAMEQSLRAERNADWYAQQLRYLNTFKYIKNIAQNYRDALSGAQIDTGKYGIGANEIISFIQTHDDFISKYNIAFENPEDLFSKTFLGQKYESGIVEMFQAFRDTIFEFTPVNVNTVNTMAKQQGVYGRYGKNFIKRIGPRLKTVLFKPFFNAYIKERYPDSTLPLRDLMMGDDSVISRYGAIKRKALILGEGTALFDVITVNKEIEGMPRFITIQSAVREDVMIKSNVQAAWAELFESEDAEVSQWAKDFAVYMFYITGGTDSNATGSVKTTLYDLVPPQHLAKIEAGGMTYNEYVGSMMENATSNEDVTFDQNSIEEALMLAAKFDDDIVPLLKAGKVTSIKYVDGENKNIAVIGKGSQKLLNRNTGSYAKYIKIKDKNSINVYRLGNISVTVGKNGRAFVNPVYFRVQDISYRNASNAVFSVRADGEFNQDGKFVSLLNKSRRFNYTSVEDLSRAEADRKKQEESRIQQSKTKGKKLAPGKAETFYQTYANMNTEKLFGYTISAQNVINFADIADSNGVLHDGLQYTGYGIPYSSYAAIDAADTIYFLYTGPVQRNTEGLIQYAKFKDKEFFTVNPGDTNIPAPSGNVTIIGTSLSSNDVKSIVDKLPNNTKYVASSEFSEQAGVADAPNYYLAEMIDNGVVDGLTYKVGEQNQDMVSTSEFKDGFSNVVENQVGVDNASAYRDRTNKNAKWSDITLAIAVDFSTAGERLTKTAAGNKYVSSLIKKTSSGKLSASEKVINNRADEIEKQITDKKLPKNNIKLNIAGNGAYSLNDLASQSEIDEYVVKLIKALQDRGITISEIRSGGQTGIDEAGVKAADALGIKWSILAPKGFVFRKADKTTVKGREAFMERFKDLNFKGSKPDAVQQNLFDKNDYDDSAIKHCK